MKRVLAIVVVCAALVGLHPAGARAAAGSDTLTVNQTLGTNQSLWSPHHTYEARMQSDGNLVVYGPAGAIWSSNTHGSRARLVMQGDSNLVMYSDQGVLFATGKARAGSNRLIMQDDGNLVLYGSADLWASKGSSERAIQWFYNHIGTTAYEHKCETAVENAFGTTGKYWSAAAAPAADATRRAHANWNNRAQRTPFSDAPRGALVFYNTSVDGHVAISLGNGTVLSSSAPGRKIGPAPVGYFQRPYGWAWSPW